MNTSLALPGNRGNRRLNMLFWIVSALLAFAGLLISAHMIGDTGLDIRVMERNLPPSAAHPFGTDWLGRDMLTRTLKGLCISLGIGMTAAVCSTILALALGTAAAVLGRKTDTLVTVLIDTLTATPHLVLLILISFCFGGGIKGVITAVALTHWTRLARVIRAEILSLKSSDYVRLSARLGKKRLWIIRHHMLPGLFPQFMVGVLLLFPHAILHAAGLTFLGFGLSPHTPAIGILLSEAMQHLSTGHWWLALGPGASLVATVKLFDILGNAVRTLTDPKTSQE